MQSFLRATEWLESRNKKLPLADVDGQEIIHLSRNDRRKLIPGQQSGDQPIRGLSLNSCLVTFLT
jgi:hypothetical protein